MLIDFVTKRIRRCVNGSSLVQRLQQSVRMNDSRINSGAQGSLDNGGQAR
jgi:hypothetical protein